MSLELLIEPEINWALRCALCLLILRFQLMVKTGLDSYLLYVHELIVPFKA